MLPKEIRSRPSIKKSKYHQRQSPKCKYCSQDAKRNVQPDNRNKGYYRTCGSSECLDAHNYDRAVNASKQPKRIKRLCAKCQSEFVITGWAQKWCSVCVPNKTARGRMQRYNLSEKDFQKMLLEQGGVCAICKIQIPVAVDHDHKTGQVRNLLCYKCNAGLHYIEDVEWSKKARRYALQIAGSSSVF